MGAAAGVPRRFTICMFNSSPPDWRAMRRHAGEGSCAVSRGRNSTTKARLASAATASRRNSSYRAWRNHPIRAWQGPARSTCSAAHKASRLPGARTTARWVRSTPAAARAGAYGRCGGASHTTRFPAAESLASAGSTSCSSPIPSCRPRISVSAAVGQPPPGSCRSSSA